jgi:hypothetical protein
MAKRYVAVYVWGSVDPQTLFTDNLEEAVNWIRTGRGEGFRMEDFGCVINLDDESVEYQQASDEDPYDWEAWRKTRTGITPRWRAARSPVRHQRATASVRRAGCRPRSAPVFP